MKQKKISSRFLSLVLRHKPEIIGIKLDKGGWTPVRGLISQCRKYGLEATEDMIQEIVANNDKQRFSLGKGGLLIRANQGHSVPIDLGLIPKEPPEFLYHGTHMGIKDAIYKEGIKKMGRHHVHLSSDEETAIKVGSRRGQPFVFRVKAYSMHDCGHTFFLSDNGVWLTDHVPSWALEGYWDWKDGRSK